MPNLLRRTVTAATVRFNVRAAATSGTVTSSFSSGLVQERISEADFRERTHGVLQALEGKLATNPDLNIRLLALCSIDKGRKQLSLHRRFRASEVVEAARLWKDGARNMPPIAIWFYDKVAKKSVFKSHVVPHPLDVASTLNRVWSTDAKTGFSPSFQRTVSAADAYDVFLAHGPLSRLKTQRCLGVLLTRMALVLGRLGEAKTSRVWTSLGDTARWQWAKAVSLPGIFLQQLEHRKSTFMKEPTYHIGQLLALADSLHQHYCKHVRYPHNGRSYPRARLHSQKPARLGVRLRDD